MHTQHTQKMFRHQDGTSKNVITCVDSSLILFADCTLVSGRGLWAWLGTDTPTHCIDAELKRFGSSANGLGLYTSDLDICLILPGLKSTDPQVRL